MDRCGENKHRRGDAATTSLIRLTSTANRMPKTFGDGDRRYVTLAPHQWHLLYARERELQAQPRSLHCSIDPHPGAPTHHCTLHGRQRYDNERSTGMSHEGLAEHSLLVGHTASSWVQALCSIASTAHGEYHTTAHWRQYTSMDRLNTTPTVHSHGPAGPPKRRLPRGH